MSAIAAPDDVAEPARARARRAADGGAYIAIAGDATRTARGPLAGMTVAVKDLIAVRGIARGAGSALYDGAAPEPRDAAAVDRLRRAGAIVTGTTALHELAFGVTGVNAHTGFPANPYDRRRIPGGSSSGSAVAVAEGSARVALGTDTGGSVRIPAALCGVVGYKPAAGAWPLDGVLPLSPTLDHVGLHARSVADVARVAAALGERRAPAPARLRLGLLDAAADGAVAERVRRACAALADAGHELVDVAWPFAPEAVFAASTTIMFAEAAALYRQALAARPEAFGADVTARLRTGLALSAADYRVARAQRDQLMLAARALVGGLDAVLEPTVPILAPTIDDAADPAVAARLVANTRLQNVTGLPAISLPLPPRGGLPAGLQLTGADGPRLLAVAAVVEEALQR